MKFKRTFHVFLDNFSSTYKLLLYKAVISVIFGCACFGIIYPVINRIVDSTVFSDLLHSFQDFFLKFINGNADELGNITNTIKTQFTELLNLIKAQQSDIILSAALIVIVTLIQNFLQGLGHFVTATLVNDKMAMHADSPFIVTMVKNLGKASIYNLIYVPLSFLYDALCYVALGYLVFGAMTFIPILLKIFIAVVAIVLVITIKMTFTTDWLPAIICGKNKNGAAIKATFSRRNKNTGAVFSNYIIFTLIIMALNVGALFLTLGAGLLITVPASYILLICFQFVNYCDDNEIMYFTDKNSIVKPDKAKTVSREDFFRGEN